MKNIERTVFDIFFLTKSFIYRIIIYILCRDKLFPLREQNSMTVEFGLMTY